jgi:diguanylate cyclase (GGDEF)-like protein
VLHDSLAARMDRDTREYSIITALLRRVRDEHPPVRYLTTVVPHEDKFVIVVDAEEDEENWSPPGEESMGTGDFFDVFAQRLTDRNVVYLDRWGTWVQGTAPIMNGAGDVVAIVVADVAPGTGMSLEEQASGVTQSFAALMDSTGERLEQARMEAITDYLTGLYNHRYLHERLQEELSRAREQTYPLSVLFLDIDEFKAFNDRHGHSLGDSALRMVASMIDHSVRHVDLAARYGGEEFVVVLVDTDRAGAVEVAERIRTGIAATPVPSAGHLSVSIGIASYPEDAEYREELIDKADWAMYLAKRGGRNRVSSFSSGQLRFDLAPGNGS